MAKKMVALDIGSRLIKACTLAPAKGESGIIVDKFAIVKTPENAMNNTFSDRPFANINEMKTAIKEVVKTAGIKGMYAFITIPDNLVVVNWLTLPVKAKEAVDKSMASSLAPLLPLELERWYWDYKILEVGKKQTTVIAEAIMKTNLEDIGNMVMDAGLIPAGVDSTFFNLINVYHDYLIKKENEKKNVCIVYQGHQSTTIAFFKGGILKATRSLQVGGLHFSNLIKEKQGITDEEADQLKIEQEVFIKDNPDLQNKNEIYNIIKPAFGDLIKGIYNSVDQYLARFREFKINEIILSGGGAAFKNIESALQSNLNTKTILGTDMIPITSKDNNLSISDALVISPAVGSLMRGE